MAMNPTDAETRVMCDNPDCDCTAKAAVIMLGTSSSDALTYLCDTDLLLFWQGWLHDPERCAYEVQVV